MHLQDSPALAAVCVPDPSCAVVRGGDQSGTILRDSDSIDTATVAHQHVNALA